MIRSKLVFDPVPNPGPKKTLSAAFVREVDAVIVGWANSVGGRWSNRRTACWVIPICGGQRGGEHAASRAGLTRRPPPDHDQLGHRDAVAGDAGAAEGAGQRRGRWYIGFCFFVSFTWSAP